jgi:hypothetical protein
MGRSFFERTILFVAALAARPEAMGVQAAAGHPGSTESDSLPKGFGRSADDPLWRTQPRATTNPMTTYDGNQPLGPVADFFETPGRSAQLHSNRGDTPAPRQNAPAPAPAPAPAAATSAPPPAATAPPAPSSATATGSGAVTFLQGRLTLAWQIGAPTPDRATFELSAATSGWVAIGFGAESMAHADVVIGWVEDATGRTVVGDFVSRSAQVVPVRDEEALEGASGREIDVISGKQTDGVTTLRFSRPLAATDVEGGGADAPITLVGEDAIIFAFGRGDDLLQHTAQDRGTARIRWASGEVVDAGGYDPRRLQLVHGISMIFSWLIAVPLGIVSVRMKRSRFRLIAHKALTIIGAASSLPVAISVIASVRTGEISAHSVIGFIVVTTTLVVMTLGHFLVAARETDNFRRIATFRALHMNLARGVTLLALSQIFVGLQRYGSPAWAYVAVALWLLLLLGIMLNILHRDRVRRTVNVAVDPTTGGRTVKVDRTAGGGRLNKANGKRGKFRFFGTRGRSAGAVQPLPAAASSGGNSNVAAGSAGVADNAWSAGVHLAFPQHPRMTREEVAQTAARGARLVIIGGLVLDVTRFTSVHPGGPRILELLAGRDVTDLFCGTKASEHGLHHGHSEAAWKIAQGLATAVIALDEEAAIGTGTAREDSLGSSAGHVGTAGDGGDTTSRRRGVRRGSVYRMRRSGSVSVPSSNNIIINKINTNNSDSARSASGRSGRDRTLLLSGSGGKQGSRRRPVRQRSGTWGGVRGRRAPSSDDSDTATTRSLHGDSQAAPDAAPSLDPDSHALNTPAPAKPMLAQRRGGHFHSDADRDRRSLPTKRATTEPQNFPMPAGAAVNASDRFGGSESGSEAAGFFTDYN